MAELSEWQQERLDKFLASIDLTQYQKDSAAPYGYNKWKINDMQGRECYAYNGKIIARKDVATEEYTIFVHNKDLTSYLAGALRSVLGYGIDTYSDHLKFSFYVRCKKDVTGARMRRIPIRYGMKMKQFDAEWQDIRDVYKDIPHDEDCEHHKSDKHNFVTWFQYKGRSWTECRNCGFNLYQKDPNANHIRLHHQGWRMRNDLRDGKYHQDFLDQLPNNTFHYDPDKNIFMKVRDKPNYYGQFTFRSVNDDIVYSYDSYVPYDQPALDNEPSYADFTKLAKEMRP
jgi:hypothetical protein